MINVRNLLTVFLILSMGAASATKRALLIGIGRYQHGRSPLNTDRDLYWVEQALRRQGFKALSALSNEGAKADSIRKSFNRLIALTQPGDKIVIHYGGHGTQLIDFDGDEKEDHLDEAIVPYDAPSPSNPGRHRSKLFIRDDELGVYLGLLQAAVGKTGHVLVIIDACHSGTLNRGQGRIRTDNYPHQKPSEQKKNKGTSDWFQITPASRTSTNTGTLVMITSSGANEQTREVNDEEHQPVGPLSYFFAKTIEKVEKDERYPWFFQQLKNKIRQKVADQTPTINGDTLSLLLGGGLILPVELSMTQVIQQRFIRCMKGLIAGFTLDSKVMVQIRSDNGKIDSLTGKVVKSTPFESLIEFQRNLPKTDTDSVLAGINLAEQAFLPRLIRVNLKNIPKTSLIKELKDALSRIPGIQFVTNQADWLIQPTENGLGLYRANDGRLIEQKSLPECYQLAESIQSHAQAEWLLNLDIANPDMQVDIKLIPVKSAVMGHPIRDSLKNASIDGLPVLRTGQQAWCVVRNIGTKPFYFSIIDILPNAFFSTILPNGLFPAQSLYLNPGQEEAYPIPKIEPPFGLETYKLLLSKSPVNIRTTIDTRGQRAARESLKHPIVIPLGKQLRGGESASFKLEEAGSGTFQFWIKP